MEIIQQKLVWLLGAAALLMIIRKLKWSRTFADKPVAWKLTAGVTMLVLGAAFGILARLGALGNWATHSARGFAIETVIGYILGWCLVLWGVIDWSREYYDEKGRPLTNPRHRRFSEIIASALMKDHSVSSLLDDISKYLLLAIDCQALSFHRKGKDGDPYLSFQVGLRTESEDLITHPQGEANLFCTTLGADQAATCDNIAALSRTAALETSTGPVVSALCVPVAVEEQKAALLTIYRTRKKRFSHDDFDLLQTMCSALSLLLKQEYAEQKYLRETRFRETLAMVTRPFDDEQSLVSSFLKSAKLLFSYVPYQEMNLYICGNGPVEVLDFNLPTGGRVNIERGYFPQADYPQFHRCRGKSLDDAPLSVHATEHLTSLVSIGPQKSPRAFLEFRLKAIAKPPASLPHILDGLGQKINQALDREFAARLAEQAGQWLGALRYYQELALASDDLSGLLNEMASLAVNAAPFSFCRIILTDPTRQNFKTAALAQIRPLNWPCQHLKKVPVSKTVFHRKALLECEEVQYDQEKDDLRMPPQERSLLLPDGAKRGLIFPLTINSQTVGLLTVGECRDANRVFPMDLPGLFTSDLAGLASTLLTWHKEKRVSKTVKEGNKKLTMKQKQLGPVPAGKEVSLSIRTRINGPLAGIIASCEYLQNSCPGITEDINRYLNVIQRNASRIHMISTEAALQPSKRGDRS